MDALQISLLSIAAIWGIFSRWIGYYIAGRVYQYNLDGNLKIYAIMITAVETGYIFLAYSFSIMPLGGLITSFMLLISPLISISMIKSIYGVGNIKGIMIFLIGFVIAALISAPVTIGITWLS